MFLLIGTDYIICSRSYGGNSGVSTSSDAERRGSSSSTRATNHGGRDNIEVASDDDSQLSYSTTGSPAPQIQVDSSPVSSQKSTALSSKVIPYSMISVNNMC